MGGGITLTSLVLLKLNPFSACRVEVHSLLMNLALRRRNALSPVDRTHHA